MAAPGVAPDVAACVATGVATGVASLTTDGVRNAHFERLGLAHGLANQLFTLALLLGRHSHVDKNRLLLDHLSAHILLALANLLGPHRHANFNLTLFPLSLALRRAALGLVLRRAALERRIKSVSSLIDEGNGNGNRQIRTDIFDLRMTYKRSTRTV